MVNRELFYTVHFVCINISSYMTVHWTQLGRLTWTKCDYP